jgi:hypothetical protein
VLVTVGQFHTRKPWKVLSCDKRSSLLNSGINCGSTALTIEKTLALAKTKKTMLPIGSNETSLATNKTFDGSTKVARLVVENFCFCERG